MNQSSDKLHYISRHKSAFGIDYIYPMDVFEQFVESTGNCMIECSSKIKQDRLYPARFNLQFLDRKYVENISVSINFLKRVSARVGVHLNLNLLQQFLGSNFDFNKIQTILVGVDLHREFHESRLKLFIRIGNYPEKVILAQKLCGDSLELRKIIRSHTLQIGFDFYLDGRSAIELYPEIDKEEFKQPEVYKKLREMLSPAACKPLNISTTIGIGFSPANKTNVLYYNLENLNDFLNYFPINDVARRVHDFYLQQHVSKNMWVALSEAELIAGKINNINLYYSKVFVSQTA